MKVCISALRRSQAFWDRSTCSDSLTAKTVLLQIMQTSRRLKGKHKQAHKDMEQVKKHHLKCGGCFKKEFFEHLARNCSWPIILARAAARKLEKLIKKRTIYALDVVMNDACQQRKDENLGDNVNAIFLPLVTFMRNRKINIQAHETPQEHKNVDWFVVLEAPLAITKPSNIHCQSTCIYRGAKWTIIEHEQARSYSYKFEGNNKRNEQTRTNYFGGRRHPIFGPLKVITS